MKITLPIYYDIVYKTKKNKTILMSLNWFRNAHYFEINKIKHFYHQLTKEQVGDKKFNKIKLSYKVFIKRKNTDYMNIRSIIEKFFLDGLVENWNLLDDKFEFVKGDSCEVFIDKDNPRMEIIISNF